MQSQEGLQQLNNKYSSFDWYDSVGLDKYGRYVVYVHLMSQQIMKLVDQSLEGKQVLIAYAGSKPENMPKYITEYKRSFSVPILDNSLEENVEIDFLISKLDQLEKIYGFSALETIFYEIHDGANAITNLGALYPSLQDEMVKLYDQYGFDIIYDQLETKLCSS